MIEHLHFGERYVAVYIDDIWYKVPLYVVMDLELEKWRDPASWEESFPHKNQYRSFYHWLDCQHEYLDRYTKSEWCYHQPKSPVQYLKEFLIEVKEELSAYQLFNVPAPDPTEEDVGDRWFREQYLNKA